MPEKNDPADLLERILETQSIQYAIFGGDGLLEFASPNLAALLGRDIQRDQPLVKVFPELTGMASILEEARAGNTDLQIDHIARPDWRDRNGYMSLHFIPYRGGILALAKDTSAVGEMEQRITQQRNELALLTGKLERTQSHLVDIATRFMPGQVMASLLADRQAPVIRGDRREVTILFADLRGFTQWSQSQTPEIVFDRLNQLLAEAVRIVLAWDGTLDKFMGDGLMVIFNAPHDQPDHVRRAVHCAAELRQLILPGGELRFGIGLHSGPAMAGNVGAAQAMNYTVLGDTVNRAKRIEETAAPGEVLISETIACQLEPPFSAEFLRDLQWNEQARPIAAYRLTSA